MSDNAQQEEHWHLRKELSVGTILSLLMITIGSVMAYADMKSEVSNKADHSQLSEISARQQQLARDVDDIKRGQAVIIQEIKELSVNLAAEKATREATERANHRNEGR